jgi:uncharacterized membrane protein YoaK (UPF0700 family)
VASTGSDRDRPLIVTLLGLTAVTGLVDAVSFLGLGRIFTANMTGNFVLLGFALAGVQGLSVVRSTTALAGFAAGSVVGARLTRPERSAPRQLLIAMGCEVALLLAAGVVTIGQTGDPVSLPAYIVITFLAVAMGLRSAAVRRVAVPDLTTTVLTLTLAGLAADSVLAGGHGLRTGRRAVSIVAMVAGAFVGAVLLDQFSVAIALFVGAAAVGVLALYLFFRGAAE